MNAGAIYGQWVGQSKSDPPSTAVLDLDEVDGRAIGFAYLYPNENSTLSSYIRIDLPAALKENEFEANPIYFRNDNAYIPTLDEMKGAFPDHSFPSIVNVTVEPVNSNVIDVAWKSEIDSFGSARLTRADPNMKSSLASEHLVGSWRDFQDYVTEEIRDGFIYRGQSYPWPLQTSFHRTGRSNLRRYVDEDIPRLHRALTGRTDHFFNLSNAQENGAFLNLAQHHGFPTPLLDWTYSPFVAAYFAYSELKDETIDSPIRIYALNARAYVKKHLQLQHLVGVRPHLSIQETLSIENDRAVPQQGLLTLTNLRDVEAWIEYLERGSENRYLFAFDLPRREREKALSDLRLMGITRATLFPGIESLCLEQRDRYF